MQLLFLCEVWSTLDIIVVIDIFSLVMNLLLGISYWNMNWTIISRSNYCSLELFHYLFQCMQQKWWWIYNCFGYSEIFTKNFVSSWACLIWCYPFTFIESVNCDCLNIFHFGWYWWNIFDVELQLLIGKVLENPIWLKIFESCIWQKVK